MAKSKFQAQHYEAIAQVMAEQWPQADTTIQELHRWKNICLELSRMFKTDNPNFNAEVFWQACNPPSVPA